MKRAAAPNNGLRPTRDPAAAINHMGPAGG